MKQMQMTKVMNRKKRPRMRRVVVRMRMTLKVLARSRVEVGVMKNWMLKVRGLGRMPGVPQWLSPLRAMSWLGVWLVEKGVWLVVIRGWQQQRRSLRSGSGVWLGGRGWSPLWM